MKEELWKPKNPINQFIWKGLTRKQPEANLDLLEEAVRDYIAICSQTSDGTGNKKTKHSYDFTTDLDMTVLTILLETTALVLSGQLDKLRELEDES